MRRPRRSGLDRTVLKVVLVFSLVRLSSNLALVDQLRKMAPRAEIEQINSRYMHRVYGRGLASWIFYQQGHLAQKSKRCVRK